MDLDLDTSAQSLAAHSVLDSVVEPPCRSTRARGIAKNVAEEVQAIAKKTCANTKKLFTGTGFIPGDKVELRR